MRILHIPSKCDLIRSFPGSGSFHYVDNVVSLLPTDNILAVVGIEWKDIVTVSSA